MVNFVESFRHVYGTQIGCIASLYKLIDDNYYERHIQRFYIQVLF